MNNKLNKILFLLLLITASFTANSTSVYPVGINITPTSPLATDFIVADIYGSYATPGYLLIDAPTLSISENNVVVDFLVSSPSGIVIQELDPFSYLVDVGNLNVGSYNITANFYVDGFFDNTIGSNFIVSAVPIPSTIFLFLSGVISIYTFAKRRKA